MNMLEDLYLDISPAAVSTDDEGEEVEVSDEEDMSDHLVQSLSIDGEMLSTAVVANREFSPGRISSPRAAAIKDRIYTMNDLSYDEVGMMTSSSASFFALCEKAAIVCGVLE